MRKLFSALALIITTVLAYRYVLDRVRAQLVGMSHPAGTMAAVRVPRRLRTRTSSRPATYLDATTAVDASWVDENTLIESATTAGDGSVTPKRTPKR